MLSQRYVPMGLSLIRSRTGTACGASLRIWTTSQRSNTYADQKRHKRSPPANVFEQGAFELHIRNKGSRREGDDGRRELSEARRWHAHSCRVLYLRIGEKGRFDRC